MQSQCKPTLAFTPCNCNAWIPDWHSRGRPDDDRSGRAGCLAGFSANRAEPRRTEAGNAPSCAENKVYMVIVLLFFVMAEEDVFEVWVVVAGPRLQQNLKRSQDQSYSLPETPPPPPVLCHISPLLGDSLVRRRMSKSIESPPKFEGLVLGCIAAAF